MNDIVLQALARAWRTSVIAAALFAGAMAIAPHWNKAGYLRAVLDAWTRLAVPTES